MLPEQTNTTSGRTISSFWVTQPRNPRLRKKTTDKASPVSSPVRQVSLATRRSSGAKYASVHNARTVSTCCQSSGSSTNVPR